MDASEMDAIVVVPCSAGPSMQGGTRDVCSACGVPVWVMPSSRLIQRQHGTPLICLECMLNTAEPRA